MLPVFAIRELCPEVSTRLTTLKQACSLFANSEYFEMILRKQPALKSQDVVVALKIALSADAAPTFSQLGRMLRMSASEVHGAAQRAITSRLLDQASGSLRANKSSLHEFLLHGVRYAFPAVEGPVTRGMPTGVSAPALRAHFEQSNAMPLVWPDAHGQERGQSICPLYPTVPAACQEDAQLYEALAALDAVRGGAARERELAAKLLARMLL